MANGYFGQYLLSLPMRIYVDWFAYLHSYTYVVWVKNHFLIFPLDETLKNAGHWGFNDCTSTGVESCEYWSFLSRTGENVF